MFKNVEAFCILSRLMDTILHIDLLEIEEAHCFNSLIQVHELLTDIVLIILLFLFFRFLFFSKLCLFIFSFT